MDAEKFRDGICCNALRVLIFEQTIDKVGRLADTIGLEAEMGVGAQIFPGMRPATVR